MVNVVFMEEKLLARRCLSFLLDINEVNILEICTRKKVIMFSGLNRLLVDFVQKKDFNYCLEKICDNRAKKIHMFVI